jgi:L-amino acid N-acyltransferase YncA
LSEQATIRGASAEDAEAISRIWAEVVAEATLYVTQDARRGGVGGRLLDALATEAEAAGYWKLVGKIFDSNAWSIALVRSCGWREVGVHLRHGRLDDEWKDVVVVERLLGEAGS